MAIFTDTAEQARAHVSTKLNCEAESDNRLTEPLNFRGDEFVGLSDIKHVVILMHENRSFDEYFGTFPGATGFDDPTADAIFNQPNFTGYPGGLRPYRMSTFTASALQRPGHTHDWASMHTYWHNQHMDGWADAGIATEPFDPKPCDMGYYAANDIPYHWALASSFALCDHYFASALSGTASNRLFLMSGCIQDPNPNPASGWPGPATYNPPGGSYPGALSWKSYADMLTQAQPSNSNFWRVYDESVGSQPSWNVSATDPYNGWGSLNMLDLFSNEQSSPNYSPNYGQFELDAENGHLPTVSWIIPPFGLTEWERNHPGDGAYNIALKLNAILKGQDKDNAGLPFWASTVFILIYDENDGHFDHVNPPTPAPGGEPYVDAGDGLGPQPIGCGFRVPAIIISPWTFGRGVQHQLFDHTSILQFLEKLPAVNVQCTNISSWRRNTLSDLTEVFDFNNPAEASAVLAQLPTADDVLGFKTYAEGRYSNPAPNALGYTDMGQKAATAPVPMPPQDPTWPPVAQSCQIIMTFPSFGQGQVQAQATLQGSPAGPATFAAAFLVVVDGFEPSELSTPYATAPRGPLLVAGSTSTCSTRSPIITITDGNGRILNGIITPACSAIDFDPTVDLSVPQPNAGVPNRFTFTYSITFNNVSGAFGGSGQVETLFVNAAFQVDTTVTSSATLELVSSDDPQFYHVYTDDASWLNSELRVFQVKAGQSLLGVPLGDVNNPRDATGDDALTFIQLVMAELTKNQGNIPNITSQNSIRNAQNVLIASFDDLNQDEEESAVTLAPYDSDQIPIFNFALARVHLQADPANPAHDVRVFFRSFRVVATTTGVYDTQTAYRQYPLEGMPNPQTPQPPNPTDKIPLLGYDPQSGLYQSMPFFATKRIQFSAPAENMVYQTDPANVQPLIPVSASQPIEAYFGCWLDINQQDKLVPSGVPSGNPDGPFDPNAVLSIQQAFGLSPHQCLVAEISYDPITIPSGDTPAFSAWLAQRNLAFIPGPQQ